MKREGRGGREGKGKEEEGREGMREEKRKEGEEKRRGGEGREEKRRIDKE